MRKYLGLGVITLNVSIGEALAVPTAHALGNGDLDSALYYGAFSACNFVLGIFNYLGYTGRIKPKQDSKREDPHSLEKSIQTA